MRFEQRQHARHGGQHRNALAADGLNQLGRHQATLEMHLGGKDGWDPQPHHLAEDMAQRQGVQKTQGMEGLLIAHVGLRAVGDGLHAGQHVAMGMDDALGVAGGAGGEENLQRSCVREPLHRAGFLLRQRCEPIFKAEQRESGRQLMQQQSVAHGQLGPHIGADPAGKIGASVCVQRNRQHPAHHAAVEGGDPLRAVLGPQQNAVAGLDVALDEQGGKAAGQSGQLRVGGDSAAVALVANNGNLAVEPSEVVQNSS